MNEILERFPVVGTVTIKSAEGDTDLPILGIKMMSDERWQELAIENSVHNYTREPLSHPCRAVTASGC